MWGAQVQALVRELRSHISHRLAKKRRALETACSPALPPALSHTLGQLSHVMVLFMCQLDWATGWPDILPNVIPGVSVRVFLDEIRLESVDSISEDCPP